MRFSKRHESRRNADRKSDKLSRVIKLCVLCLSVVFYCPSEEPKQTPVTFPFPKATEIDRRDTPLR